MSNASRKAALRAQLGIKNKYPYVYQTLPDWKSRKNIQKNGVSLPMIKFDVKTGIDPSKLVEAQKELQSQPAGTYSPFDTFCAVSSKSDYWVVAIPPVSRPK